MATRNLTMVVRRGHAEHNELGFAADPAEYADKSYVNMYLHHDGYPEWQGVQLANWIQANNEISDGARIASKLVHDHYYDSCYLYEHPEVIDHQYTYVIWTGDRDDMWISCYDQYKSGNVFVLKPQQVIEKYRSDMEYTVFSAGETRSGPSNILHPSGYD